LPEFKRDTRWQHFPHTSTLIDIAIQEGRHDDVLRWYRQGRKPGGYGIDYEGSKVAQAVQETHPNNAISIWKEQAAKEIVRTKPAAYQTEGGYLGKIQGVYERTNRMEEWNVYLSGLRGQNSRRPRMLEVLDSLEGRRTRIVK
jgi:uncharacterized Zn finger protein